MREKVVSGGASTKWAVNPRSDRRRRDSWLVDVRYALWGRRRELRRHADRRKIASIVDCYPSSLLLVALATVIFSAADAAFTLVILNHGIATEANPAMRLLLDLGVPAFVGVKMLVTGVGVVLLVAYFKVRTFGGLTMQHMLVAICGIYACLVGYELVLLNVYL